MNLKVHENQQKAVLLKANKNHRPNAKMSEPATKVCDFVFNI